MNDALIIILDRNKNEISLKLTPGERPKFGSPQLHILLNLRSEE